VGAVATKIDSRVKRYLIVAAVFAALLLLLWTRRDGHTNTREMSDENPANVVATGNNNQTDVASPEPQRSTADAGSDTISTNREDQQGSAAPDYVKYPDVPVMFYGLVVDQDTNALQNVRVDIEVRQWDPSAPPDDDLKTAHVQKQTGADGRFEVSGLNGHSVTVRAFTKDGYEPEFWRRNYGEYGSQAGGVIDPEVFRMWSTNLHEPLVSGEKSFVVTPDGRHYAIDLLKGTIAEGDNGDLLAWIKRPEKVMWGQRYDWSCELTIPAGGLLQDSNYLMFRAPEAGYTNAFVCQEHANPNRWSVATGDKRFYVRLRNGQMYGRITINLYADYHGKQPAMIHVSYAVNPSGSRLLR
jgi:hypothetical protein